MNTTEISMEFYPSKDLISIAHSNFKNNGVSEKNITELLSNSISGFLATISQGLAYGEEEYYSLGDSRNFNVSFLKGLFFRIPLALEHQEFFSATLYQGLIHAVNEKGVKSEFGQLIIQDNCLVMKRLQTIVPKVSTYKRAKIVRIG